MPLEEYDLIWEAYQGDDMALNNDFDFILDTPIILTDKESLQQSLDTVKAELRDKESEFLQDKVAEKVREFTIDQQSIPDMEFSGIVVINCEGKQLDASQYAALAERVQHFLNTRDLVLTVDRDMLEDGVHEGYIQFNAVYTVDDVELDALRDEAEDRIEYSSDPSRYYGLSEDDYR